MAAVLLLALSSALSAQEYRVEPLKEGPPEGALSAEFVTRIAGSGIRVMGPTRPVCDIWWATDLETTPGFTATPEVLYPFQPGQLIGVLSIPRRGYDFRDQRVNRGLYTLRFGQQPIDGNHEGTSPTRDFLALVAAEQDQSVVPIDEEELNIVSAESIGSTHPAIMCLQKSQPAEGAATTSLRHNAEQDWWILETKVATTSEGKEKELPIALVVVGHAAE